MLWKLAWLHAREEAISGESYLFKSFLAMKPSRAFSSCSEYNGYFIDDPFILTKTCKGKVNFTENKQ